MTFLFFLLLVKHFVCDFGLQGRFIGRYPPGSKRYLFSPALLLHAFDHALGNAFVFAIFGSMLHMVSPQEYTGFFWLAPLLFGLLDFVLHIFIDWRKNIIVYNLNIKQSDRMFWKITTVDQILHVTCYWLYVWLFDKFFF